MTIIAKRSVQLKGHIYSKGEPAEWNGPIDSRMAANFMTKDGKDLKVTPAGAQGGDKPEGEKGGTTDEQNGKGAQGGDANVTLDRIQKLVKELGRKGIEQKLDELGVGYRAKTADSQLALLLLQQQGEV